VAIEATDDPRAGLAAAEADGGTGPDAGCGPAGLLALLAEAVEAELFDPLAAADAPASAFADGSDFDGAAPPTGGTADAAALASPDGPSTCFGAPLGSPPFISVAFKSMIAEGFFGSPPGGVFGSFGDDMRERPPTWTD